MTKERFEQIKKDGKLMAGNIGPAMFRELVDEIERLRPEFSQLGKILQSNPCVHDHSS